MVDFARLGFEIQTGGLERGKAAVDAMTASGVRLGQVADNASLAVTGIGSTARTSGQSVQALSASTTNFNAQLLAEARALAGVNSSLQQQARALALASDAQGQARIKASDYLGALRDLKSAHEAEAASAAKMTSSVEAAAGKMSFLGAAIGSVVGIVAFQFIGAIGNAVAELARLPYASAEAADSLTMLEARLKFAFRGSGEAVRQARRDIESIANETGRPFGQVAQEYGDIAVSGRSAGLTRAQSRGLTSAFSTLGLITGAGDAQIGRAQWQLQQALAIGRLNYQDYRLMASSVPAIDDALGAGLGVDPSRIPGMISRGEISAERLVNALTRGVDVLAKSADGLPAVMERSRGRLQTEWELMLQDMGRALRSSDFFQAIIQWSTNNVRDFRREFMPDEDYASTGVPLGQVRSFWGDVLSQEETQRDINRVSSGIREFNSPNRIRERASAADTERESVRRAQIGQAITEASSYDSLGVARQQIRTSIESMERRLAAAADPAEIAAIQRGIALARAQLSNIMSGFARLLQETGEAEADLRQYGPGGGFNLASQARSIVSSSRAEGAPVSMATALQVVLRQRLTSADNELGADAGQRALARRLLLPAIGNPAALRAAQIDFDTAQFAAKFGAANDNNPDVQARVAQFRAGRQDQADYDVSAQIAQRAAADEARVRAMRDELGLGVRIGQEGRIQLAQLQRMQELRAQGLDTDRALVDAELQRVAAAVKLSEQIDLQHTQLGLLQDSAQAGASVIGNAFSAALTEGVRTGTVRAITILNVFEDSALRIANNILRAFLAPYEQQASNFLGNALSNFLPSLFGGGGAFTPSIIAAKPIPAYASGTDFHPGGLAWVGDGGEPELVNIPRGASVTPASRLGGGAVVNIYDQRSGDSEPAQVRESGGPNGERVIDVIIKDKVNAQMASGAYDRTMRSRYGATQALKRT